MYFSLKYEIKIDNQTVSQIKDILDEALLENIIAKIRTVSDIWNPKEDRIDSTISKQILYRK